MTKEKNIYLKLKEGGIMAVSIKPTPVFKGDAAKKIGREMSNPRDNSKVFEKCERLSKRFEAKK